MVVINDNFYSELLLALLQSVGLGCSEAGMQVWPDLLTGAIARVSLFSVALTPTFDAGG